MDKTKLLRAVYAVLIDQGQITNGKWSYYGSGWENPETPKNKSSWTYWYEETVKFKGKIKEIGIAWDKMEFPDTEKHSYFAGTFAEGDHYKEATLGNVVLNNGESHFIGANIDMPFSDSIKQLYEILSNEEKINSIVGP